MDLVDREDAVGRPVLGIDAQPVGGAEDQPGEVGGAPGDVGVGAGAVDEVVDAGVRQGERAGAVEDVALAAAGEAHGRAAAGQGQGVVAGAVVAEGRAEGPDDRERVGAGRAGDDDVTDGGDRAPRSSGTDGSAWWIVIATPSDEIVAAPLRSIAHVARRDRRGRRHRGDRAGARGRSAGRAGAAGGTAALGHRIGGGGAPGAVAAMAASAIGSVVGAAAGGVASAGAPRPVGRSPRRHRRRGPHRPAPGSSCRRPDRSSAGPSAGRVDSDAGVAAYGVVGSRRVDGAGEAIGSGGEAIGSGASRWVGRRSPPARSGSGVTAGSAALSTTTVSAVVVSTASADAPSEKPRASAAATAVDPIARSVSRSQRRGAASSWMADDVLRGRRRANVVDARVEHDEREAGPRSRALAPQADRPVTSVWPPSAAHQRMV